MGAFSAPAAHSWRGRPDPSWSAYSSASVYTTQPLSSNLCGACSSMEECGMDVHHHVHVFRTLLL